MRCATMMTAAADSNPTPSGRNWLPSSCRPTPPEAIPGPRTCVRWSTASCTCCASAYPAEASYFRWVCRRLSAQDEQRVCPRMAACRQSLQRPDFFILRRCSAARARPRSCRSSGVRRTGFGFWDAFGFEAAAAGFEVLRAGVRAASGLAGFFFLRFGSCSWS